ncbi:MAG TPA: hypothetical protein VNA22_07195 [Pyrinomonadaceae bacterium]|nr:hypothetical protein [Pyrinomonadaceae bacterium]
MGEIDKEVNELERLRELPISSEEIGFASDEMSACPKCGRSNSPLRALCMYCGATLEGSGGGARIDLRELESWENGFNVFLSMGPSTDMDAAAKQVAGLLNANPDWVHSVMNSAKVLPIARVESEEQAGLISDKLIGFGIQTVVLTDEALSPADPPVRLRSILFGETELGLTTFGNNQLLKLGNKDLALIVSGVVLQGRTESLVKRKRRATETVSETQTSSDEAVLDIYSRQDRTGWRVPVTGFDFSCLGHEKSLFAAENIESLTRKLAGFAPNARVVRDYANVRTLLENAWPVESRRDSLGIQRSGIGGKSSSAIYTTNNLVQLTKYSRLQWHLL